MTFSIVGRSADGESWGVAVASKFLAVGSAVPAAVAGVGAIATQAEANVAYKGLALSHMDEGATAEIALQRLLEEDEKREDRQVGLVDVDGGAATHTGSDCFDWAGGVSAHGVAIQGNILVGPEVVEAMKASWDSTVGQPLPRRLLAALTAGDEAEVTVVGASQPRSWWCVTRRATAVSTTWRSTSGSTTIQRRSPSWPGCSTSTTST